jgi:hypothetical protein
VDTSGKEGGYNWKGIGGWIWCKYSVCIYVNGKMRPFETIPEKGREDKGECWRWWIKLWCIVGNFVNIAMYPQHKNNRNKI